MRRVARRALVLATAAVAFIAADTPVRVHPHVFAEATLQVQITPDRNVESLGHVWRFDDLFSSTVLLEFDTNKDLVLDDSELEAVSTVVYGSLADYDYFQIVSANGANVEMSPPDTLIATFQDEQLTILFQSKPMNPLSLDGTLAFGVYDPTFYTAIDFTTDANMIVEGMPDGCTRKVVRPDPDEAIAANQDTLTEEFYNDPSGTDYGNIFATRLEITCGAAVAAVAAAPTAMVPRSSLGIGTNEAVLPSTGLFAGFFNWVNAQQQGFYRALTGALKTMRQDGSGTWLLIGLSFAYGIFHAAGPGHGKAVISSYMLANEVTLRRGVMLSFVAAFLQALTAVLVMAAVFLVLRGTSVSMTDATWFLEIASYALITGFGLWLLWQKAGARLIAGVRGRPAASLSAASVAHDHAHHHHHDHAHHGHSHGPGEVCDHAHMPDPALLSSPQFNWRSAWAAMAAVGLRPCSGALIVLSFAFLNGLWVGGIVSVLAMALGTAITVSTLAILAVTAKNWAVAIAGDGRGGNFIHAAIEIGGAALVFLLGLTLLVASLGA